MSDVRTQPKVVKPQQELRFGVRMPILDEAIVGFEKYGKNHNAYLPRKLYLMAAKAIRIESINPSQSFEQNASMLSQYVLRAENIGNSGRRDFALLPYAEPLRSGGPSGDIVGVGLRVALDPMYANQILRPPLFGKDIRADMSDDERASAEASNTVLESYRHPPDGGVPYIPVRYEIGSLTEDPERALARMRWVLARGAFVSQMRFVPSFPRSARTNDLYTYDRPVERTFDLIDREMQGETSLAPPQSIDISDTISPDMKSAG